MKLDIKRPNMNDYCSVTLTIIIAGSTLLTKLIIATGDVRDPAAPGLFLSK